MSQMNLSDSNEPALTYENCFSCYCDKGRHVLKKLKNKIQTLSHRLQTNNSNSSEQLLHAKTKEILKST